MTTFRPVSLIALIFMSWQASSQTADNKVVEQWKVAEFSFTSKKSYQDQFNAIDVDAVFQGPDGVIIKRPAFWDGGQTWKVRVAFTRPGRWQMITSCTDSSNHDLAGVTKTIDCEKYDGSLDVYRHGFLKVAPNGRYFIHDDGTPFFYLGDTHWLYIHERYNTSNVKNIPSQFKYIVDKRVAQGFTVYQTEAIQHPHGQNTKTGGGAHNGKDEEPYCNFRDGFTEADLPGFANIDSKFRYIADKGLVNANSAVCWALDPAEFPASYSYQYMYKLGRYWAARFGAYPVLWTIAQEIDRNMYKKYDSTTINKWFAVAKGIADNDTYHHPLTAHMENASVTLASNSWWSGKPYHAWWAVQWQEFLNADIMPISKDFWMHNPAKPSVLYESSYEGFWTDDKGARGAGYKAFQSGIFGYGYGANGVWNDLYSVNPPDYGTDYEMPARYLSWFEGANLNGAKQLTFLKKFYTAIEWWKLVPRFDDSTWSDFLDKSQSLLSTDGQQTFVVYFFNRVKATGSLKNLEVNTTYFPSWCNPRTGVHTKLPPFRSTNGKWTIPQKPDDEDWILLIKKIK